MITASTKLRPIFFGVILLILSILVLVNTVWQTLRANQMQTDIEKLQLTIELRTPSHCVNK